MICSVIGRQERIKSTSGCSDEFVFFFVTFLIMYKDLIPLSVSRLHPFHFLIVLDDHMCKHCYLFIKMASTILASSLNKWCCITVMLSHTQLTDTFV